MKITKDRVPKIIVADGAPNLHQLLGSKVKQLPEQACIGGLLRHAAQGHYLDGHRSIPGEAGSHQPILPEIP